MTTTGLTRKGARRRQHPGAALEDPFSSSTWKEFMDSLPLSRREREILKLVFEDAKEDRISAVLKISPHTVHTHTQRLFRKFSVGSRTQLLLHLFTLFIEHQQRDGSPRAQLCPFYSAGECPRMVALPESDPQCPDPTAKRK